MTIGIIIDERGKWERWEGMMDRCLIKIIIFVNKAYE